MPGRKRAIRQCLAGLLMGCVSAVQADSRDTIDLVSFEEPPYVMSDNGGAKGLVVEYVSALMDRAGLRYRLDILPAKRALLFALSHKNACVFPIERSQEREVDFHWISPIQISRHGFFQHPDDVPVSLRVLEDAKGFRIGSYLGSGIGAYLESLGFEVDYAAANSANIHKLMARRIDLWASDEVSARYIAGNSQFTLAPSPLVFFTTVRAIGCHASMPTEVVEVLNDALQAMHRDGSFMRIKKNFEQRSVPSKP